LKVRLGDVVAGARANSTVGFYFVALVIIIVINVIGIQRRRHSDAVIGFVSGSAWPAYIGDTAFIKGFIAIWTIILVVDAALFRPLVAGIITRAIDCTA